MSAPVSSTAPTQVPRTTFQRIRNSFTNRGNKFGRNAVNFTRKSLKRFSNLPGINTILTRLGITSDAKGPRAAIISAKATAARITADTLAFLISLSSGALAIATMASVAAGPMAPAALGFCVLLSVILRTRGMNQELRSNLEAIQGEVDSMFMIACVVEEIAKENNINLNTATVNRFLSKLTNYIALIAGPDAMNSIIENRSTLQTKYISDKVGGKLPQDDQTKGTTTQRNTLLNKWGSFFNRAMSPGEYLRVLVRDVIILHIFFTIMMSEFDLFMRAKGDTANKKWITSPAYKLLLASNKALMERSLSPIDITKNENKFADFYGIPIAQTGGNNNAELIEQINSLFTPALVKGATESLMASALAVGTAMKSPVLGEQLEAAKEEEVITVQGALLDAGVKEPEVAAAADAIIEENSENQETQIPTGPQVPGPAKGGKRRTRKYRAKKNNRRN